VCVYARSVCRTALVTLVQCHYSSVDLVSVESYIQPIADEMEQNFDIISAKLSIQYHSQWISN